MVATMLELPKFLDLERIVEKANRGEKLRPRELSNLLSRTFGPNIEFLSNSVNKKNESDKTSFVTNLNNQARFADELEDNKLRKSLKIDLLQRLSSVYSVIDVGGVMELPELIDEVRKISEAGSRGVFNEREKIFLEQYGRGQALAKLKSYRPAIRNSIVSCMNKMTIGMIEFLKKGEVKDKKDLKKYCYFVAGTVGDTLNNFVRIEDGENLPHEGEGGRSLALFFQMTNIIKNFREDYNLRNFRNKFIFDSLHEGISYNDLFEKNTKDVKKSRERILQEYLSITDEYFTPASNYVFSRIPIRLTGYEAFCAAPLIVAKENQKLMEKSGPEQVFKGKKSAIKVSRPAFKNIMRFVYNGVRIDDSFRFRAWGKNYQKNPKGYSFEEGEFQKWAHEVFGF